MELKNLHVRMNYHPKDAISWTEEHRIRWIDIEEAKKFFLEFIEQRSKEGTFYFYLFDEARKNWEDGWEEYGILLPDDEEVLWLDERLK